MRPVQSSNLLGNVTIRQLRAFVCVAESLNFTLAAEILCLSQSAVSQLIKELESQLTIRLFNRTTRYVVLTDAGQELLPFAIKMLGELRIAVRDAKLLDHKKREKVRVACSPLQAAFYLPKIIAEFGTSNPDLVILINDCAGNEVLNQVVAGEVDVGIVVGNVNRVDLEYEKLFTDGLYVAYHHELMAVDKEFTWKRLSAEPFIGLRSSSPTRQLVDALASSANVLITPVLEVSFVMTALGLVNEGLGYTLIPFHGVQLAQKFESIRTKAFLGSQGMRDVFLVWKKGRQQTPSTRQFVEYLLNTRAKLCAHQSKS